MRRLMVGVAVTAVLAGGCSVTVGGSNLDLDEVVEKVTSGMEVQYDIVMDDFDCPDEVPLEAGDVFTCQVTDITGNTGELVVTQTDDQGNIRWEIAVMAGPPMRQIEGIIEEGLADQVNVTATVACPEGVMLRTGNVFTCVATDTADVPNDVRVTLTNEEGGIDWEWQYQEPDEDA